MAISIAWGIDVGGAGGWKGIGLAANAVDIAVVKMANPINLIFISFSFHRTSGFRIDPPGLRIAFVAREGHRISTACGS